MLVELIKCWWETQERNETMAHCKADSRRRTLSVWQVWRKSTALSASENSEREEGVEVLLVPAETGDDGNGGDDDDTDEGAMREVQLKIVERERK